jgi:hypothetical protein
MCDMVWVEEADVCATSVAEKLALNMLFWFICACAVFVIVVLGVVICPMEHVFSLSELASHTSTSGNSFFTAVQGEVSDLGSIAVVAIHQIVGVVPLKAILKSWHGKADDISQFMYIPIAQYLFIPHLISPCYSGQRPL